eukprot:3014056-Pyramimonas_sp.AAC.1
MTLASPQALSTSERRQLGRRDCHIHSSSSSSSDSSGSAASSPRLTPAVSSSSSTPPSSPRSQPQPIATLSSSPTVL